MDFITVSRSDPQFEEYLKGSFSNTQRALPVKSYNVSTQKERVTFRLVDVAKVKRPPLFILMARLMRLELLSLTLSPIVLTWFLLISHQIHVPLIYGLCALFTAFFLHGSVFLLNDYYDHLNGVDRIGVESGSRVIQKGHLAAYRVRKWAFGLLLGAFLLSLPIVFLNPKISLLIAFGVFLGVFGYSFAGKGFKKVGLGPTVISLCLGPMITLGFSLVLTGVFHIELVWLGLFLGYLAALYLQLRDLENVMVDSQVKMKTLVARLGFDRSKLFIMTQVFISLVLFAVLIELCSWPKNFYLALIPFCFPVLSLIYQLRNAHSPLSSSLMGLKFKGSRLHLMASCILFLLLLPR